MNALSPLRGLTSAASGEYTAILYTLDRVMMRAATFGAEGPFAAIAKGMDLMMAEAAECYELWRDGTLVDCFSPETGNSFGSSTSTQVEWKTAGISPLAAA